MNEEDQNLLRRVALTVCVCVVFAIVAGLLYVARNLLPLVFGAALLAVFFNVLAARLGKILPVPTSQSVRVGLVVGLLLTLGAIATFAFANSIGEQAVELADRVDQSVKGFVEDARQHPFVEQLKKEGIQVSSLWPASQRSLGLAKNLLASAFGGLTDLVILAVLTIFFCFGPDQYRDGALRLFPVSWRDTLARMTTESAETLWRWTLGRLFSMLIVGVLFGVGLWMLGVPLAMQLGVFAGLISFIPNVGAVAAVLPALLLATEQGVSSMIGVLVLYGGIQFVESYVVTPTIQKHQVAMPPALVILSQIVSGLVFGFWGIVFATPLFALVLLWIRRLYVESYLESQS